MAVPLSNSRFKVPVPWRKASSLNLQGSTEEPIDLTYDRATSSGRVSDLTPPTSNGSSPRSSIQARKSATSLAEKSFSAASKRREELSGLPTLSQARNQAILVGSCGSHFSLGSADRNYAPRDDLAKDSRSRYRQRDVEVGYPRKRTGSDSSTYSTRTKTFVLTTRLYVLQYDDDCMEDALPEEVFIIDQHTQASICHAIPKHPWTLQLLQRRLHRTNLGDKSLRSSHSRFLPHRLSDEDPVTRTMQLVFAEAKDLHTWLSVIRKRVEQLNHLSHEQDTRGDNRSWKNELTEKYQNPLDLDHHSMPSQRRTESSERFVVGSSYSGSMYKDEQLSTGQSARFSNSSGESRISTSKLGSTSTKTPNSNRIFISTSDTNSSAHSAHTISSNKETAVDHSNAGLALREYDETGQSGVVQHNRRSSNPKSLLDRRRTSVSSLKLSSSSVIREMDTKPLPNIPSTIAASPDDLSLPHVDFETSKRFRPTSSVLTSEPPKNVLGKANDSDEFSAVNRVDRTKVRAPASASGSTPAKAQYSLFPSRQPSESKSAIVSPPPVVLTEVPETKRGRTSKQMNKTKATEPSRSKSRSRTLTLKIEDERTSHLLSPRDFEVAQRSPAVTDRMILSNFGAFSGESPASPVVTTRVPSFKDLGINLDFLDKPYQETISSAAKSTIIDEAAVVRSSSVRSSTASSRGNPIGPPPTGPLPEIPAHAHKPSPSDQRRRPSSTLKHSQSQDKGHNLPVEVIPMPKLRREFEEVMNEQRYDRTQSRRSERHKSSSSAVTSPDLVPVSSGIRERSRSRGKTAT